MKLSITNKNLYKYRKTHNFYLYTEKGKTYYKLVPKAGYKKERKLAFWPTLAIITLILAPVALSIEKPRAAAEIVEEPAVVEEVTTEEEATENKGDEVEEASFSPYSGVCAEYYELVKKYFNEQTETALAVMYAESRCNPGAVNENKNKEGTVWSRDYGLMQINDYYHDVTDWQNPETNIKKAYEIFRRAGGVFTPWAAFNSGAYLKYL